MPCASSSIDRARRSWVKPGNDELNRSRSCTKTKPHPTQIKPVPRYLATLRLRRIPHLRDINDLERQPAHQIACALDEAEAGIRQFQLRLAEAAGADGDAD